MLRRFLPVLIAQAGACHPKVVHKPGEEWLAKVDFQGNKNISRGRLLDGLVLHRTLEAGRAPDPYSIELDADRLRGQYAREGYFDIDVQPRVDRRADATTVTYAIEEGVRSTTRIQVTGLPNDPRLTATRVLEKLPLHDGDPFDYDVFDAAKVNLLGVAQDAGYAHAKLDAHVETDPTTRVATVVLAFTTGPKCTFGKVTVNGIDGELRDAIFARLRFKVGDTYSSAAVVATQRAIYGMNRFSTVQVQPEPGDSDVVAMQVAVSKSASHEVELGGGFGIDPISYEVRGRAGYQVAGWPTPLDTFTVDLRPAYAYLRDGSGFEPRMRALVRLEHQDLFVTYAVGSIEVGYDYLTYEAFTEYGPRAQLGYEVRLGTPRVKLRVGYLIERYDFTMPSPLVDPTLQMQIGIDHPELVGAYQQTLIADFRDHPIEPRLGIYAEIKASEGTRYAGSDYTFQEIQPELRGYVPIGPVVLAARARYGAIFGDVPPTERFYGGGASGQRGFAERELSPSVTGLVNGSTITVPYGGAGMIDGSIEARFPITKIKSMPLGGVVFLDEGDVTETPAELDLARLQYAAGVGLRLHTIVGPARADFGYRLNRTGPDDPEPGSKFAFHISLGEAF